MTTLREALSTEHFDIGAELFQEYALHIGLDLEFQNFNDELKNLKKQYSRPDGILFIAYSEQEFPMGCFGIRRLNDTICELKRMYLKKEARGKGLGKIFMKKAISLGKELGYSKMRLDTLPSMLPALGLYKKFGFYEIPPYRFNPIDGTKYLEIQLT
ncbi:GNAT family N-acetyltransferase [Flagellimonas sp. 2504JD1-5]